MGLEFVMAKASARLISRQVSTSKKLPELSPEGLNLFLLLIPHFNAHGKMNGDPYYIKGEIVPRFIRFTVSKIEKFLKEISAKTNVKWFQKDGLWYIHSLSFAEHQPGLRSDRMGEDILPNYPTQPIDSSKLPDNSESGQGLIPPEVEEEVEEESIVEIKEIVSILNNILGTNYDSSTKETQRLIKARLKEGRSVTDFKTVIEVKYKEWADTPQAVYLRPKTLFSDKFEGYLNQKAIKPKKKEVAI